MMHRVPRSELDQSLRAIIGSEHIDKVLDDIDPAFMWIITDDQVETRPLQAVTLRARLGIEALDQAAP